MFLCGAVLKDRNPDERCGRGLDLPLAPGEHLVLPVVGHLEYLGADRHALPGVLAGAR